MTRPNDLRAELTRRFHHTLPLASRPAVRWIGRVLIWGFGLIYFSFILLILSLRYVVLPHIEEYRPAIEQQLSEGLGQSVRIGRISARWAGIHPDLTLHDVNVTDAENRTVLTFARVGTELSWWSVPTARLQLRLLEIDKPTLHVRRNSEGQFLIAGMPIASSGSSSNIPAWILSQQSIRIHGATVVWDDEYKKAPTLVLDDVNIALDNNGKKHQFGLTAQPPKELASRIDIQGEARGADINALSEWSGQVFAEFDHVDLAAWQLWIDYPISLPQGHGTLRSWLTFSEGKLQEVVADMALQQLSLKLAEDLPSLKLENMFGRLLTRFTATGITVKGQKVELTTRTGSAEGNENLAPIRILPTDFEMTWLRDADGKTVGGSVDAERLDIGALVRLTSYLPLDAPLRQTLSDYAPQGRVSGLSARWKEPAGSLPSYSLKTEIQDLGIKAKGSIPGFSGISGMLEANEQGGKVTLHSKDLSIDLPAIFSESLTRLDSLTAQARWKIDKAGLNVELSQVEFSNSEAAGSAQGNYRTEESGPGIIDMTVALTRADARAVWRYLPNTVGVNARHWLRDSLLAGKSTEAKLILKGNLKDFPFLDKKLGQFLVTVKARDAVLDYGKGWPRIDDIHGDLRFEGTGMEIDARQGKILGATLSKTHVAIPNFHEPVSTLLIEGQANGPTAEFLKFIDQSPVAEQINHFTEDIRAAGNGRLDIDLNIPLAAEKLKDSKISGTYVFLNNEVTLDTGVPPLRQVNGSLRFSGSDLSIPGINAVLLGGPLKIQGGMQKDGRVLINADGRVDIAQLRSQSDHPLLAHLSGSTPYHGEVRINKRNADLVIESTLSGIASTFPEPFAKAGDDTLPLHFEKKLLAPVSKTENGKTSTSIRDQISASLGSIMSMDIVRQKFPSTEFTVEKGIIAIGRSLQLPEKGMTFAIGSKRLDLGVWQKFFDTEGEGGQNNAPSFLKPDTISLQAGEMVMRGLQFNEVDLLARAAPRQWKVRLNSRQAAGDIIWNEEDNEGKVDGGRLSMRLSRLLIDSFVPDTEAVPSQSSQSAKKLPALDIIADDFSVRKLHFGRLEMRAKNDAGVWNLSHIKASNPYGSFTGNGRWQHTEGGRNQTQLNFKIDSTDVGKLLGRMGYPGTLRDGTAQLDGKLSWAGPPTEADYASMSGDLDVVAHNGQFLKLDPGAAGKLLGLISLQSLPRRISLDFKDVFSEGFAFDSLTGKVAMQKGVMRTDQLQVSGPSARVLMRGEVDLKQETQHLTVNVLPEVGDTAALGVAIINPVAGAATWLANKVLQNPLGNIFGFNYRITGTWDDPKVEKLTSSSPADPDPLTPIAPQELERAPKKSAPPLSSDPASMPSSQ